MKINILYPCDYFNKNIVDESYKEEYEEAIKFEFNIILFDYDTFVQEQKINIYPNQCYQGTCIYRGWMLKPEQYQQLYSFLSNQGICLINNPTEYENCHLFPNSYPYLKNITAKTLLFNSIDEIDWDFVKSSFDKFMIKDYVKSVKGTDFPKFFDNSYTNEQLNEYIIKFQQLRGNLYTGGIVIKEFLELVSLNGKTNEYRAFYLYDNLITLSKNSNQSKIAPNVPSDLILKVPKMKSNFYTVDFAQLSNGEWIVIETGDGQVSGLSPNQFIFKYYEEISLAFLNK